MLAIKKLSQLAESIRIKNFSIYPLPDELLEYEDEAIDDMEISAAERSGEFVPTEHAQSNMYFQRFMMSSLKLLFRRSHSWSSEKAHG